MARKLRIQFPGAIYHVMSRGDRREDIFRDDVDRRSFIETLADTCAKTGWQVHAFVLMPNHFHLVVETPQPNLVAGMKWFLGTYTVRFNRRHKVSGHVFSGRYKSLLVGGEGGYLRTVCDYVHLNPARARMLAAGQPLAAFPWSSLPWILGDATSRPEWLRVERLFGECGIARDEGTGRSDYAQRLEARRASESNADYRAVRGGWCLGSDAFRRELLAKVETAAGRSHFGGELSEAAEARAGRIVDEELRRAVWAEAELTRRRKSDPVKLHIARRLRTETTVTLQWIASRLHMGTQSHLSHLLYWTKRAEKESTTVTEAKTSARNRTAGTRVVPETTKRSPMKHSGTPVPPAKGGLGESNRPEKEESTIPLTDPSGDGFDTSFD